ncbi:hypothetical protein [Methylocystis bryophila]|uniref:Phasin domain-containing protein n=1 Tax=Methylocystis bryophila TaxID=655015 RepID=A0A1W6MVC3_9HYPH|nr:hypothetical protein [Methylocystis bryophila]ARN81466.1 hypothetical protein B1812_10730 [Methylocystis bryophila]BDV37479.1 hypothetical protein DSM21852_07320 [Methylocystis bryophila]
MTKQRPGPDEKVGSTRTRGAKIPSAAAIPPAEESVSPVEATVSLAEEEQPAAFAAPVVSEAAPEVAPPAPPAPASEPVEPAAQIVLLASEAEADLREQPSAFSFSWSVKSLEFWRENTQAFYRLASELGAARTPGEIVEAHSRFAVERLRAFGRHAEEMSTVRVKYFYAA